MNSTAPELIHARPVPRPSTWVWAAVVLVLVAMFVHGLLTNENYRWDVVGQYLLDPRVVAGVGWTLLLTLGSMFIGIVLAVLMALRMARRVAQPLASLAEGVRDFDPSLPTGAAVMVNADAEVLVVAQALDEMRARVQALVARERAFTRDVSHELRTPLAVIRSTAAQALHDDGMRSDSRRLLTMALNAAEQMERTVTSLLTLARDDLLVGPAMPTRILPTLEQVVVEQSLVISGRDISLDLRVPAHAALHVSETVLHMLLSNLLGNAFAHTASGNIRVTFVDGTLRISNPVDDDRNERVVPKLHTLAVPGVRRDDSPGYGFGLDIVARLCARAGLALHWQRHEGVFDVWVNAHDR